jgi:hypothetical protein
MRERTRRRWGDNDYNFGPLTFSFRERWRHFALLLSSGCDEYPGCSIRVSAFGNTMIIGLPQVIKPYVGWHDLSHAEWAKPGPDGRKGYTEIDKREFGFICSNGHLSVKLGRQTMDSSTTQDWGCFLPWRSWRHVRHSFYGLNGEHVATLPDTGKSYRLGFGRFERERAIADATPTVAFEFADFDGERLIATTRIEEREWRLGEGHFKWLSIFRRPKVDRSLDIRFSGETGKRKGSWKGGTIGHSISMRPGELHEAAFRRYCAENSMKFIARPLSEGGKE